MTGTPPAGSNSDPSSQWWGDPNPPDAAITPRVPGGAPANPAVQPPAVILRHDPVDLRQQFAPTAAASGARHADAALSGQAGRRAPASNRPPQLSAHEPDRLSVTNPGDFFTAPPEVITSGAGVSDAPRVFKAGKRPAGKKGSSRPGKKRRRITVKKVLGWSAGLIFVVSALLVIAFAVFYAKTPVGAPKDGVLIQGSKVVSADGVVLAEFKEEQRTVVELSAIPKHVQDSVIAIEDRTFYTNKGVSPRGIVRAAWNNWQGGDTQGGSTITQQYVKNFFLTSDQTYKRKATEFVKALKISREVPKDTILEQYLNQIYFGRNAYGIQAASQAYFGVDVGKLTVSQGAFLAGIINGPNLYDPSASPQAAAAAQTRWSEVLSAMVDNGSLSAAEEQSIRAAGFPKVTKSAPKVDLKDQRYYVKEMVRKEAESVYGISQSDLDRGGFLIATTFNSKLINAGIDQVTKTLGPREKWPIGTQVAMVTLNPADGSVVSLYGGNDKRYTNGATQDMIQAGSTFKPFTLIAALEGNPTDNIDPLSLKSQFNGASPYKIEGTGKQVTNFGGKSYGWMDLIKATANSVNTVYVQLNQHVHPSRTIDVAVRAGLPSDTARYGLKNEDGNTLGSASPTLLQMASAYSTIANQGKKTKPHVIVSVTSNSDQDKRAFPSKSQQVIDSGVIADATWAMQDVIKEGSGKPARELDRQVAGKTGTSEDNQSAWFIAFTPQLVTAVVLYRPNIDPNNPDQAIPKSQLKLSKADKERYGPNGERLERGSPLTLKGWGRHSEITGGSYPAELWTNFMKIALNGTPKVDLPSPVWGGVIFNEAPPSPTIDPSASPSAAPSPSGSASPGSSNSPSPTNAASPGVPTGSTPDPTNTGQPTPPGASPTPTRRPTGLPTNRPSRTPRPPLPPSTVKPIPTVN